MDRETVRKGLNPKAQSLFDDIVNSRVLGAGNHIRMIGEILTLTAGKEWDSTEAFAGAVSSIAEFFKETRGSQSRAVYNAVCYYTKDLEVLAGLQVQEAAARLAQRVAGYAAEAEKGLETLARYGADLADPMDAVMIFDYSSTVERFISRLRKRTAVYIPESRALDGGRPFIKTAVEAGHEVHFIPDTAMYVELKKCQAAFIGAETVYPDGTVFNTVGSDILAVLCRQEAIPLYALTPMIKVDTRPVYGYTRLSPMPFDYRSRLAENWEEELKGQVDFRGIKLLKIRPEYITALITERGILPPAGFFGEAMDYARSLEGGML